MDERRATDAAALYTVAVPSHGRHSYILDERVVPLATSWSCLWSVPERSRLQRFTTSAAAFQLERTSAQPTGCKGTDYAPFI